MHWTVVYLQHRLQRWRIYGPAAALVLVAAVLGVAVDVAVSRLAPPLWRAERSARSGEYAAAERLYWQVLAEGQPEVPVLLDFLEIHEGLAGVGAVMEQGAAGPRLEPVALRSGVSEAEVDAFLDRADLPPGFSLVGRYWRSVLRGAWPPQLHPEVAAAASSEPPMPWANHVLALAALRRLDRIRAAALFEREGLREEGPTEDLARALHLYRAAGTVDELSVRVADPRFARAVTPHLRAELAFAERSWGEWLLWQWPAAYLRGHAAGWLLAALAAGLWLWFCSRLGGTTRLHIAAFCLGILSIYPTDVFIHLEELVPALQSTGEVVGDAVHFILGVGLREEAAKLLLFAPLLLVLRKSPARGEGLVLGALVGLGFAAVENVSYLSYGDLSIALGRFMTANFLHISLTAIVAEAVTEAVRGAPGAGPRAVNTFGLAVVLHGVYDLFLACPQLAEMSFFAMTTFVIIAQRFLRSAPVGRARGGIPLLRVVVLALVILSAASFVYGAAVAGAGAAALSITEGLLGVILIIVVFHRELGPA